jgi:adenylate cyclase
MIDKYIGDSIMAFWNAPEPDEDHIANACRAALQAAAAGRRLSEKWRGLGRPGFRTRFGLHTGPAVVGNVGARERINYTLVGAVANQASRLEGMNKVYGTEVLASGEVANATADRFVWRHIDRTMAVGTTEIHDIHEPLGGRPRRLRRGPLRGRHRELRGRGENPPGRRPQPRLHRPLREVPARRHTRRLGRHLANGEQVVLPLRRPERSRPQGGAVEGPFFRCRY